MTIVKPEGQIKLNHWVKIDLIEEQDRQTAMHHGHCNSTYWHKRKITILLVYNAVMVKAISVLLFQTPSVEETPSVTPREGLNPRSLGGAHPHLHCWGTWWSTWPGWTANDSCNLHPERHRCAQEPKQHARLKVMAINVRLANTVELCTHLLESSPSNGVVSSESESWDMSTAKHEPRSTVTLTRPLQTSI